jgi:glycosyltransferase involved in cell wall biosynthesis
MKNEFKARLNQPEVTLILPVRNEEKTIKEALNSVIQQDYPLERMKILVVDGMSTDQTRPVIQTWLKKYPEINLNILDNPQQIVPTGLNIGIREASGDFIIRVDGHCRLPTHYVSTLVSHLQEGEVQNVGGQQHPVGDTYFEKAVALATSSPYFIGNSYFRYAEESRLVDTVFLGAYPREVFDQIGLFDETLVRHQDYDFNLRLRNAGGKILYLASIQVDYRPRSNLHSFFMQYFQYGVWKVRVMQKSERAFQLRHFPPTLLVLGMVLGGGLSLLIPWLRALYLLGMGTYLSLAVGSSLLVSLREEEWKYLPVLPILFACIHIGWGSGFWWGVMKWNLHGALSRDQAIGTREADPEQ